MKVQIASDLHLEFLQRDFPGETLITPHPDTDVLVLAKAQSIFQGKMRALGFDAAI